MSILKELAARQRAEMGEEAYKAKMARVRAARQGPGGPFRLDYVAPDGRTGSQIAAEAGRRGGKASPKRELSP